MENPTLALRSPTARSRVTNAKSWLIAGDQRSALARRYRDIVAQICVDQGGADRLAEARLQLIRRFAASAVLAEQMEAKLAAGEEIDVAEHALLCSSLVRLGQRIGINRVPKNITPSLTEYLRGANQDRAEEVDA